MIFGLFGKNKVNRAVMDRQYGVLTAAARQPAFYRHANAPDTVMGRFEMLSVILILYFRRTARAGEAAKAIAQDIVDAFFQDLDHSIRELGIGDQGVPKRMKKLASMFYGRLDSYGKALDAADVEELSVALKRNFYPETTDKTLSMRRLADYMMRAEAALHLVPESALDLGDATILQMEDGEDR